MHDVGPPSGTSQSFEDVPLSPLNDEYKSSVTPSGFPHVPLEHEIVASRSVWDDSAASDELSDQQSITSTVLSGQGSPAAAPSTPSEDSLSAVEDQAQVPSETSRSPEKEEPKSMAAVFTPSLDLTRTPDAVTLGTASAVTLLETPVAPDSLPTPIIAVNKVRFSTESLRDGNLDLSIFESDINNEPSESSDELTVSNPSATVLAHATLPRVERPETSTRSSIPEFFEVPIPIFPFPAGTTRCKHRDCPIKHRHEQGPYLHKGKLRTREGSIFGSSNPPPEVWFLYDMSRNETFQGTSDKAFASVQLFVKYHFGETRGEYIHGPSEAGRSVQKGEKQAGSAGKKSRFWRFWG